MIKRVLVTVFMAVLPVFSYANECSDANMKTQRLKKESIILFTDVVNKDVGSSIELLIKQYERLTNGLKGVRELADISENTLKHCMGNGFTKEIYSLKNKERVMFSVAFTSDFKVFYDKYLVPNDTWTEAANALEDDILAKRDSIKVTLTSANKEKQQQEVATKERLNAEMKELHSLQELVNKTHQLEVENRKLSQSVETVKNELEEQSSKMKQNNSRTVRKSTSTYQEGKSTFYVKSNNLFCLSEKQFDYQINLISQGVMKPVDYCYETAYDVDVVVLDYGMLGKTEVRAITDGTTMWVTSESIGRR